MNMNLAIIVLAGFAGAGLLASKRADNLAAITSNVMLQAMDRGYQCHAAGRALEDCRAEQRLRWANPDTYSDKPFGNAP